MPFIFASFADFDGDVVFLMRRTLNSNYMIKGLLSQGRVCLPTFLPRTQFRPRGSCCSLWKFVAQAKTHPGPRGLFIKSILIICLNCPLSGFPSRFFPQYRQTLLLVLLLHSLLFVWNFSLASLQSFFWICLCLPLELTFTLSIRWTSLCRFIPHLSFSFSSLNTHKPNWHARCPFGCNCSRPLQFSGTHYVHALSAR